MRRIFYLTAVGILGATFGPPAAGLAEEAKPPAPFGAVPSARQVSWQRQEFIGFVHFSMSTFTGREWGFGDEPVELFNPEELDARQWARVARDAGMKSLILTAKHHDGFCLWPSKLTEHSVKNSPWKGGKGDVVKELADACREFGLGMGVFLSPWDRNHADYGKPAYLAYYRGQLEELLTDYGAIREVWFDGANGGDGFYGGAKETRLIDRKTYYDWPETWKIVRRLQPDAVMFSDAGPDIRWVGNERGQAPATCWATINPEGFFPGEADRRRLAFGEPGGKAWRPAEVDVSLRKGWFFHEDQEPKPLRELLDIYYHSVGHGCCLLLNLTPDTRGLVPDEDVERLKEFRAVLESTFKTDLAAGRPVTASNERGGAEVFAASRLTDGDRDSYWAVDDDVRRAEVTVDLGSRTRFNRVRVQEHIPLGQRVAGFAIDVREGADWREVAKGTTIGAQRILRIPTVEADKVRLRITEARACPVLSTFEVYLATAEGG